MEGKPTRYIDTPYVDQPVFFCHNGLMAYNNALYLDSAVYSYNMEHYSVQEDAFQNEWGVYTVCSDTVKATFYMTLANDKFVPVTQRTICHFEGVIQNDSTIRDWKLVPPYPKYGPQSDFEINDMKQARTLTFKSVPIQRWIDPNNAWINRFRETSTREPKN
ncbi:hypothetical protein QNI16_20710 [Cytophagaceae bacterium YF14B1]|uniref:Uncharacterized protein n=1 Tax=Xanthocytophaga flava TaxID=3048013 RepID=A0AAE3QTG2_9BACT|nr:hypothetical protein [Xanthocytophaga flavus]